MQVSDLLVRCLENEGVSYVFGVPGEETEDLLFSLADSSIEFIPMRHEQGAAFMADVWGRLTGQAGVCLATLGPGATNLVTGVADATLDKSPVVAITGQAGRNRIHQESHQYLDVISLFRPIVKWTSSIPQPDVVPEVVRKAFKIAEGEKPGSTHIELSEDVAKLETQGQPLPVRDPQRGEPLAGTIVQATDIIAEAKYPIVMVGNGAIRHRAAAEVRRFVEQLNIPAVHTFMGQGVVSDFSDHSLHTIGLGFRDYVMEAMDKADLIIAVGYDLAEYAPKAWNANADKAIVHIDSTPADVYTHYVPTVEIIADIRSSLEQLTDAMRAVKPFDSAWYRPIQQRIRDDIKSYDLDPDDKFHVPGVLNILRELMGNEDLLISDVGAHKMWIARNFPVCCPNGCLISNGLASMGIALPGGIAASLQNPQRRVVSVMGDGGFLMNAQELETAKRLGVGFTVIVFNDNDYGLISWKQEMHRRKSTGTRIGNPDIKAFAESFGIKGYRPESVEELRSQLSASLDNRELSVFEIPVDQSVNDGLIQKLKQYFE